MKFTASLLFCLATVRLRAIPAFPGAEGAGANAQGGRGGTVLHVTTNSPALPFNWADTGSTNFKQRFYRIQLGP